MFVKWLYDNYKIELWEGAKLVEFLRYIEEYKNSTMSELGKKSAEARKKKGHDSEYYRQLAKKRWNS